MGKLKSRNLWTTVAILMILGMAGAAGMLVPGLLAVEFLNYPDLFALAMGGLFLLVGAALLVYRRVFSDGGR